MKTVRAFWSDAQMQIDFRGRLDSHHGKCTRKGTVPGDQAINPVSSFRRTNNRRAFNDQNQEMNYFKKTIPPKIKQHKKNPQKSGMQSK